MLKWAVSCLSNNKNAHWNIAQIKSQLQNQSKDLLSNPSEQRVKSIKMFFDKNVEKLKLYAEPSKSPLIFTSFNRLFREFKVPA